MKLGAFPYSWGRRRAVPADGIADEGTARDRGKAMNAAALPWGRVTTNPHDKTRRFRLRFVFNAPSMKKHTLHNMGYVTK